MDVLAQQSGFRSGLERSLEEAAQLLPRIGYFLVVLVLGVLLAKVLAKVVTTVLRRAGFDRAVERGGIKRALSQSSYDAAGILGKIVYYFVLLLVLSGAFSVFGPNPISDFLTQVLRYLPNAFAAVVIIVIASAIAAAVKDIVQSLLGGLSYGSLLANVASGLVVAFGVFAALDQLQIAPAITNAVFYALLALVVVPPIVAFGVGGIEPARETIDNLRGSAKRKAQEVTRAAEAGSQPAQEPQPAAAARRTRTPAAATGTRRTAPDRTGTARTGTPRARRTDS